MSAKSTKGVRKLERPRPLRLNSDPDKSPSTVLSPAESVTMLIDANAQCAVTDEDVLKEIEMLHISVNNGNYDATILPLIANVCDLLKLKGASMESSFKDQLDCYFVTLRNASREERLDVVGRLRLLEVIELRAMGWKCNENLTEYYKRKLAELEGHEFSTYNSTSTQMGFLPQLQVQPQQQQHTLTPIAPATSPPLSLQPTEVLKSSGKFGKPAKIPGRNFLKDEIVIRNSDSGKVNPGVRDRLVQITGPSEETITRAKELIEDTIRRNASPVREMGDETTNYNMGTKESSQKPSLVHSYSMGDASVGEYTTTITVGREVLRLSGPKAVLIRTAKLALEKYFSCQGEFPDKIGDGLSPSNQGSYVSPEPVLSNNRGTSDLCTEATSWQGLAVRRHSGPPSSQTSSSSDEETYKEDADQELMEKVPIQSPKHVSRSGSIVKNLPTQIATKALAVVEPSAQSKQFKRCGSSPEFSAKAERPQVPSASLDSSDLLDNPQLNRRTYSREFLLECSQSSLATQMPTDFPSLDPEVANLMVKQAPTQSPNHVSRSGSRVKNWTPLLASQASPVVGHVCRPRHSRELEARHYFSSRGQSSSGVFSAVLFC
uniref:K Homology domain-containing protein n=1 Tax=Amblyomma maculatum TaxID=34609 RepID=G3MQ90_AMBMU